MTDHDYIRQLAAQLDRVTEFRIPCPDHRCGHLADLRVTKQSDGRGDGWAILNDSNEAWTGSQWRHRSELARSEIYRYDRQAALDEADRIAPLETAADQAWLQRMRDQHREPHHYTPGYAEALAAAEAHAPTQEP